MTIFNIISLLGGLALFLFGMNTMSSNLEKTAGGKLEKILKVMTDKPIKALLLGTAITATIALHMQFWIRTTTRSQMQLTKWLLMSRLTATIWIL